MSVLEAGEDEPEVIEPMSKRLAGNRDAERTGVGEVGQSQSARLMRLTEDHVLLGPVERTPTLDAALQRAADVGIEVGVAPAQLLENADDANPRRGLQDRHDFGVPVRFERVWPSPPPRLRFDGGQTGIGLDPIPGRGRECRPSRGGLDGKRFSILHVEPHLAVGDVDARQTVELQ